jgi:hypothetical protein
MHSNGHRKSEHKAWIIYLMMEYSLTFWMQKAKEWSCITGFVSRLTRQVPLVEQDLLTLLEHLSLPPVFSGVCVIRSLVLCVCFVDRCLSFCPFSFDHCVVCPSIYGFWLPLWYLQTLLKPVTFLWLSQSQDMDFKHHMLWSFFLCSVS